MEGLFCVTLQGQPTLHLVIDPASPQETDWETGLGGSSQERVVFFSSVGLMNEQEEKV